MNHSIYSADRSTHLKIGSCARRWGYRGRGFSISARYRFGRVHPTRASSRPQAEAITSSPMVCAITRTRWWCASKIEFTEFTPSLPAPQKSPLWIIEDPNYPQVDYRKRPLPRAFSFCGVASSLVTEVRSPFRRALRGYVYQQGLSPFTDLRAIDLSRVEVKAQRPLVAAPAGGGTVSTRLAGITARSADCHRAIRRPVRSSPHSRGC